MRTIVTALILSATLTLTLGATGCGSDSNGASCEAVADHFLKVAPPETAKMLGSKKDLVASCEKKSTPEQRKCALAATDMAGIMKCSSKNKK